MIRPFPHDDLQRVLRGRKGVAVVDQNISVGKGGILFSEIASALYGLIDRPPVLLSFIGGLGGRRFRPGEFDGMLEKLENPTKPPPKWRDRICCSPARNAAMSAVSSPSPERTTMKESCRMQTTSRRRQTLVESNFPKRLRAPSDRSGHDFAEDIRMDEENL